MPDDGYDTNLIDLAHAMRNGNKAPVAPTNEGAPVAPMNEGAALVEDDEEQAHQLSDYEMKRLQNIQRNQERLNSLGLLTKPPTATKKRRKSEKEKGGRPPLEKRPRSSRLQAKAVVNNNKEPTQWDSGKVLEITFAHTLSQIEKCHPDNDDGGKRGRFSMAKCLADGLKQYMVEGCPKKTSNDKWNYVKKLINLHQQTARSERSSENAPSQHCLVHLPKTTKFLGAQIVASKCAYPQFACRGGCGKRVRTYCSCSPGQIICNKCFVRHTVKCDAEAAAEAALSS